MILWHINPCWSFYAKSFLYMYIKYIGFGFLLVIECQILFLYIKHDLLNDQTVLPQAIAFSISPLFAISLKVQVSFAPTRC